MADWTPIEDGMPPEGLLVDAIGPGGGRLRLEWQDRLWLFADGSNYVYFTPTYWRPARPTSERPVPAGGGGRGCEDVIDYTRGAAAGPTGN